MKKIFLLILIVCSLLFVPACTPACSEELTAAQCANEGTHKYVRTYNFVDGCGKAAGLVEGISEFTWDFSPQGDTITFAAFFPDSPPVSENLISIEPNVYRPAREGSLPNQIHLTETGFNWSYFDPDTNDLCYQVIFTLSEE